MEIFQVPFSGVDLEKTLDYAKYRNYGIKVANILLYSMVNHRNIWLFISLIGRRDIYLFFVIYCLTLIFCCVAMTMA